MINTKEPLDFTGAADGDQAPQEWLGVGEDLHEQGIINRAEVRLGSLDPAAIKAGHLLTAEGRAAIAISRMKLVDDNAPEVRRAA